MTTQAIPVRTVVKSAVQLRPYQDDAIEAVRNGYRRGLRRIRGRDGCALLGANRRCSDESCGDCDHAEKTDAEPPRSACD